MSAKAAMRSGPVLTTYADPAQFAAWLESAKPGGHPVIYATGPSLGKHPTAALARDWAEADKLLIWSEPNRHREGCKDYKAKRLQDPVRSGFPSAGDSADPLDNPEFMRSPMGKVYAALADCAARGGLCPTNDELAWLCQFPSKEPARYRFGQLVKAGLIRLIEPNRYKARVIEIVATGHRTAPTRVVVPEGERV